jgi:hypothetical protein
MPLKVNLCVSEMVFHVGVVRANSYWKLSDLSF